MFWIPFDIDIHYNNNSIFRVDSTRCVVKKNDDGKNIVKRVDAPNPEVSAKIAEGSSQGQASHDRPLQASAGQQPRAGTAWEARDSGALGGNR